MQNQKEDNSIDVDQTSESEHHIPMTPLQRNMLEEIKTHSIGNNTILRIIRSENKCTLGEAVEILYKQIILK